MAQGELAGTNKDEETFGVSGIDELQPGTVLLHGQYTISRFINNGGFGITYLAKDSLDRKVVIKECFPGAFCRRTNTIVSARSRAHQSELKSIIRLFVQEARSLSKLVHPNIVGVHQVFEDNDTAYMAIDFIDGKDLLDVVEDPSIRLEPQEIVSITRKMLDAIGFVHEHGVLHRDISPDNILLTRDREPILIDFGAAREHASNTNRALSALRVVKDGYSPQEFYIAGSEQGPWSDLYALAASLYHVIKGIAPVNGQARLAALAENRADPYEPLTGRVKGYPPRFLEAIDKALKTLPKERLQTADEWLAMLDGAAFATGKVDGNPEIAISNILKEEAAIQAKLDQQKLEALKKAEEDEIARKAAEAAEAARRAELQAAVDEDDFEEDMEETIDERIHQIFVDENQGASKSRGKTGLMLAGSVIAIIAVIGVVGMGFMSGDDTVEVAPTVDVPAPTESGALDTDGSDNPLVAETDTMLDASTVAEPDLTPADITEVASAVPAESASDTMVSVAFDAVSEPIIEDTAAVSEAITIADETTQMTDTTALDTGEDMSGVTAARAIAETDLTAQLDQTEEETTAPVDELSNLLTSPDEPAPAVELTSNQVAFAHWDIRLPFTVSNRRFSGADVAMITSIKMGANLNVSGTWIKEGTLIYSINGDPLDNRQSFAVRILNDLSVDPDGFTRVAVRFKADAAARFERGLLAVPVVRQIGLANGVILDVQAGAEGWETHVISVPEGSKTMLRAGDILVAERESGIRLDSPEALDQALSALVDSNTPTASFRVERNGGMAVAELDLKTL